MYRQGPFAIAVVVLALAVSGCASVGPDIRTDYDRSVDLSVYRTFGFPKETGTDRGGYSTLVTKYFKEAVTREMEQRGYKFVESHPDLLVNFYTNVRERTAVAPGPEFAYGYYGYRYGLYGAWPLYHERFDTVTYRVGTVNLDVVDAAKKQLIWEGVAEGELTADAMNHPQARIDSIVAQLMRRYPGRPNM